MEALSSPGFGGAPAFIPMFAGIVVVVVVVIVLAKGVQGLITWSSNNAAEMLNKPSEIVTKRTQVWGGSGDSRASTSYYITFEFEDHSRQEFEVKAKKFGMLVEGDIGILTYQGTRFIDYARYDEPAKVVD
ncbi:Protein of unknown function [Paenibacillus uliginis N3/975]|uniref:DUF2500 domain-containing protein n=1 Tax=Paenibacillus uliginis N3/975 TaxID=1313296 RepID=A0A1X7HG72_9BACL|nr:DUF2500 domain-containing protein [Paenibacillus uliginis]SMF86045.1 Protein of unknown function [Paenibacillus uliginis N3/975]